MHTFENLSTTLIGMSRALLCNNIKRITRGFTCYEMPYPVCIEITNPTDRYCRIKERKWNKTLPWIESLWIALGLNNLNTLPGHYVKSLYNYSDNGETWRAGYGPRIRAYSGLDNDYHVAHPAHRHVFSGKGRSVDQLAYVIEALKRDINTRQAIIEIGDPAKDCFSEGARLLQTKDYPCTRLIQFMVVDGRLNCTIFIRSNDLIYGLSAVNIFNFTLMQEYVATLLNLPIGKYYHIINNLHVYEDFLPMVETFASLNISDYTSKHGVWQYPDTYERGLSDFDNKLENLFENEKEIRNGVLINRSDNVLFSDWTNVLIKHWKKDTNLKFVNPYLNDLYND